MKVDIKIQPIFLICAVICITVLATYGQVKHHEFVTFDDGRYVTENQNVQAGLTFEGIRWAFGFSDIAYWHPLTWLSHMLDCQLYGLRPGMHHITNLLLHVANSLLVFIVFQQMTGAIWRSACVAVLFALHPINVESVAWVAERKNVLSTFFWMLTLLSYHYYAKKPLKSRLFLTVLMFALGLLTKPALVTLPFLLLLLDFWPLQRLRTDQLTNNSSGYKIASMMRGIQKSNISRLILEKIPLFVLSGASIVISLLSVKHYGIVTSAAEVPLDLRTANALVSFMAYIGKTIWPLKLAVFYPYPTSIPIWLSLGSGIWLICVSVLVIRLSGYRPYLVVGWLWYLGTLMPHLGFIQAGLFPAMADRWAYVPLIGLFMIISWGAYDLCTKWPLRKPALIALAGIVFSLLMIASWFQVRYWANSIALYQHAIDVTSDNDVAHNNLGAALYQKGNIDESIIHFIEALRIMPGYAKAHTNLNTALASHINIDHAIVRMQELLRLYPNSQALYYNLGNLYRKKGELDNAISQYQKALTIQSNFIQALNNMASVYVARGEYEEALFLLMKMIKHQPQDADLYYDVARIYSRQNKVDESIDWLKRAIQMGYQDWHLLQTDKNLTNIRNTDAYKNLIKGQ
jgi:Flp pilus assembly protein TadD